MRKTTIRAIAILVAAVLITVAATSYIAKRTNGLTEDITWEKITSKVRNSANLLDPADYTLVSYNAGNGIKVVANEDGSVTVNGKLQGENDVVIEVGTVSLGEGTFIGSTGWNNASLYTAYFKLVDATTYHNFDFGDEWEYATTTAGTVYLVIKPDVEFNNVTFYPVINEGTTAASFYTK